MISTIKIDKGDIRKVLGGNGPSRKNYIEQDLPTADN